MTSRTLSIVVVVLLVLGIVTSAVVVMQNQQIAALRDAVIRLTNNVERNNPNAEDREVTAPDTSGSVMEPVGKDLIPSGASQVYLVKRTYPQPGFPNPRTCTDYKIVAAGGGPAQDVLLESFVQTYAKGDVITEGGGCIDYTLRLGVAKEGRPATYWIQIVTESLPSLSPIMRITPGGDTDAPGTPWAEIRTQVSNGVPMATSRYWVGAEDANTLAVVDVLLDRIVAQKELASGRTLVEETGMFDFYGDFDMTGTQTVQYETFASGSVPDGTDRRLETWIIPSLP